MPYDGSSNWTLPANTAAVSGATVQSTKFNSITADLEAAINDLRYQNLNIIANLQTFLGSADLATARTNLGLGTGNSPQFTGIEIGHATDTTLARVSAGVAAIEGKNIALNGTSETWTTGTIELGHASDTTLSRSAAGVLAVEGGAGSAYVAGIELGNASDTTVTRSSAGVIAVEGVTVPLNSTTNIHTAQQIELGHATDTTLSRSAAGVMAVEGNVVPSPSSQAQYDMLVRGASSWDRLAIGTTGQNLVVRSGTPTWSNVSTFATVQASTSGTAIDFTSIPSWVKEICVIFDAVSISGTDHILVQLGDSGGVETSGYTAHCGFAAANAGASSTAGMIVFCNDSTRTIHGCVHLVNATSNTWIASVAVGLSAGAGGIGGGSKSTSGTLDRVRVTTTGSNTFDAGQIGLFYR